MASDGRIAARVARIRSKLARLAPAPDMRLPGPPVPEDVLADFEAREGIALPAEFRLFATEIRIDGCGPGDGLVPMNWWKEAIEDPLPGILSMACALDPAKEFHDYDEDPIDSARGTITLAQLGHHANPTWALLIVSGPNRGPKRHIPFPTEIQQVQR